VRIYLFIGRSSGYFNGAQRKFWFRHEVINPQIQSLNTGASPCNWIVKRSDIYAGYAAVPFAKSID
jgi:hypothetical protein